MRIDDKFKFDLNRLNDTSAKKKGGEKSASSGSSDSASGDQVSLSSVAKDVAGMKEGLKGAPEIRVELVQELKVRIENGQYNVSGRDVAEKKSYRLRLTTYSKITFSHLFNTL